MSALTGKVAIVTGASSGIGRAVAGELAALGAAVVLQARRKERLDELAKAIAAGGGQALVVPGDAGHEADIDRLMTETLAWRGGKIDIVIVNAGRGLAGGLLSSDQKQWEQMYQTNVMGAALLMRKAGEVMVKQKSGDILVLGSVAGHNISPFSGFYGSSKWALWSMAEAFRREVCARGVRVTAVMPAIVVSEFQQVAGYTHENFGKTVERYGKLLEPADVARTIAFVVSQPPHVHINELVIRPTGQDYP
jgi:NADP-dependent 3-hydroxy acid dehydrogenase YdfG